MEGSIYYQYYHTDMMVSLSATSTTSVLHGIPVFKVLFVKEAVVLDGGGTRL